MLNECRIGGVRQKLSSFHRKNNGGKEEGDKETKIKKNR